MIKSKFEKSVGLMNKELCCIASYYHENSYLL